MTVEIQTNYVIHSGNGVATQFPYTFRLPEISMVEVALLDATTNDVVQVLTYGVDFNITGVSQDNYDGGEVTYPLVGDPMPATNKLLILRTVPLTQGLDLENQGGFYPESVEYQLDKIVFQIQQLNTNVSQTMQFPLGIPPIDPQELIDAADDAEAAAAAAQAAADAAQNAVNSVNFAVAYTPDDITSLDLSGKPSLPAINVLGYPTSPGASHDWVRADSEPSHPMKEQDANGQWWEINTFVVRAENFGVWKRGQGVSATLQNAVDFCMAMNGGAALVLPAGDVYLENDVTATLGTVSRYQSIQGQGYEATRLILDGGSGVGGIHFEQPTLDGTDMAGHFRNFGIVYDGQGTFGVPALRWKRPEGGAKHGRSFVLENVRISGKNIATDYAGAGVDVSGCHHPLFQNYQFTGPWGPGVPNGDYSNTSIIYAAEYGINMDGTYQGEILNSQIWDCRFGIYNRSSAATGGEGLHLRNTNIVQVRYGLYWQRTGPEPTLWIDGCHINYRDHGLHLDGVRMADITNNVIYQEDTSEATTGSPIDIYLKNYIDVRCEANRHHYTGDSRRYMYQGDSSGTYRRGMTIIRPRVSGSTFTGLVFVGAGQQGELKVIDPYFGSDATMTGPMFAGGGAAEGRVNYTDAKITTVNRTTSNQSIPDTLAAAVPIAFNAEQQDDLGLHESVTNPSRITIPAGSGVKRVKFTVSAAWASNATGARQLRLYKNGAPYSLGFNELRAATNTNAGMVVSTGWITTTGGDYWEVYAGQSSGGALDLLTNSYLTVEVG